MEQRLPTSRLTSVFFAALFCGVTAVFLPNPLSWSIYPVVVSFAFAVTYIFNIAYRRLQDPYGRFHHDLNRNENDQVNTEWLNMGYWESTTNFPEACKALAIRLVQAAHCKKDGVVLDVGHGSGDSLLLHLGDADVPRARRIVGITSLPSHHARAVERIKESSSGHKVDALLYCGDAVWRSPGLNHPLNPASSEEAFTSILALDCAYHFRTRSDFIRQCFKRLQPGGTLALTDLYLDGRIPPRLLWLICFMFSLPQANVWSKERYIQELREAGFEMHNFEDITAFVFPGFLTFLRSRGVMWALAECCIGLWARNDGRYAIISATKAESSATCGFHYS